MLSPSDLFEIHTAAGFAQVEWISISTFISEPSDSFICVCIKSYAEGPQVWLHPWDTTAMEIISFLQ